MGFLDKVKSTVEKTTKTAQGKIDDVQAKKRGDHLLHDLGAAYFASRKSGVAGTDAEVERLVAELQAHEAEHGPVGTAPEAAGGEATVGEAAPSVADAPATPAAAAPPPPAADFNLDEL